MHNWAEANRAFYDSSVWSTLTDPSGRRVLKYPNDLWMYSELITKVKPQVVVETGSGEGGSAAWFAERVEQVISIDLVGIQGEGVTWIRGSSTDPAVLEQVTQAIAGKTVMVSLDSDHHAEHVYEEMCAYGPMVSPGSYMVVEDTAVDAYGLEPGIYPEGGPGTAVKRYLAEHGGFEPDPRYERLMLGMNPGGWLRRV